MKSRMRVFLGAAGLLVLCTCGRQPTGKFNVVLITIDSLRADHTGPYGHTPEFAPDLSVTPNMDKLAQSGAVFEDAWSSSSWTLPSHMSLMTGLTDRAHGVEFDAFALDPLRKTVAEQFLADGYATGGCYSGMFLDPKFGFGRGFQEYHSGMLTPQEFAAIVQREHAKGPKSAEKVSQREIERVRDEVEHTDVTSPRVNAFALDFLKKRKDQRFFLFLHYFDAHFDYRPDLGDREMAERFDPGYGGKVHGEDWYIDLAGRVMTWQRTADQPPAHRVIGDRDLHHALALYDAEIHWVDRHVGEILDQITALGLEENTIVIVTSDHGDEFFEHGSIGHRSSLYAELCHVPLVVRVPGVGQKGQRVTGLARLYDLAPSLLDWCGLPPLPEAQGASLRPLMEGLSGKPDERTILQRIYARFNRDRPEKYNVREAFRNREFTVVRHLMPLDGQVVSDSLPFAAIPDPRSGRDFLVFDRVADPVEARPLSLSDPRWRQAVDAYCEAWKNGETAAAAMVHSPMSKRWSAEKSDADRAALSALGYVNAGDSLGARHPEFRPFPSPCLQR
jgi:arylsulfatase A-like enzyme